MNELWSVVIVAAGRGSRMGTKESKQYLQLGDKPILVHTLESFQQMAFVNEIIIVVGPDDIARTEQWCAQYDISKVNAVIAGGAERQDSVYLGVQHVTTPWVMVHDGVRPFVTEQAVKACCEAAHQHDAAVLAVPVKDTIKQVDANGVIEATPDRNSLWAIQTPQAFRHELLLKAHKEAEQARFVGTDDAMVVERLGVKVVVAQGEYANIKITTPEDLPWAEQLLRQRHIEQ